jgi:hypothetical protein
MKIKAISAATLCLGVAMFFIGCGGAANTTTTSTTNSAANHTTTTAANTTAANSTVSTGATASNSTSAKSDADEPNTGVAECDEYIKKYEACLGKIAKTAPQVEQTMKQAFMAQRNSFKTAASNPQAKATLSSTCKQAMETAKTSTKAYACEW